MRQQALKWWHSMSLEEQFYKTIKHNKLITRDCTRHPNTLTSREIETIYKVEFSFNMPNAECDATEIDIY